MVIVNNFDNRPYTPEKIGNLNSKTAAGSCGSSDDRGCKVAKPEQYYAGPRGTKSSLAGPPIGRDEETY